jgi:uncharacterized protein (TIGR00730 family)
MMQKINFSEDIRHSDKQSASVLSDDYEKGSQLLADIGAVVSIFGSARFGRENFYCERARNLAKMLADEGLHITSGGSGGIMEAANEGAKASTLAHSLGFNLRLPFEQKSNPFTTRAITLNSFSVRKRMLIKNAVACVAFPGGFGTLDEIFDTLALVQTRKVLPIKIYLYGEKFWRGLKDFMKTSLVDFGTIGAQDLNVLQISDDLEYIVKSIKEHLEVYLEMMRSEGLEQSERYALIKKQFENFKKKG